MKKLLFILSLGMVLLAVEVANIVDKKDETNTEIKLNSNTFGAHLFSGNFKQFSKHIYNPDYKIAIGDVINIKLWGAVELQQKSSVDSQGNIFIPQVGVIHLLGISNKDLVNTIQNKVKQTYKSNVYSYADMDTYQNISVFVTGNVNKPGLYEGLSSDSLIQYIDKAGGINLEYGSFRNIQILRNNQLIKQIDLYDFLLNGKLDYSMFKNADVILINQINGYVSVSGEVLKPYRFELGNDLKTLKDLAIISNAKPTATNAIIKSYDENNKLHINAYKKSEFDSIQIKNADEVEFRPDYTADKINIKIEGEHNSLHSLVIDKGTTLQQVLDLLNMNELSNAKAVQVYRKSVAKLQKKLIDAQLKELETLALTTTSSTLEEAKIRDNWATNILKFVEKAKNIEPKGQIVIDDEKLYSSIVLEDEDIINIPSKNNLVVIQGEVALPGAFIHQDKLKIKDYLKMAGDLNSRADKKRVLLIHANGKADKISLGSFSSDKNSKVLAGDSILVLPKVESYSLQATGLITQIIYQIAVATKVILDI